MTVLITGGASCGKSAYAERLAASLPGPRIYIATLRVGDAESQRRVDRHRARRAPFGFETLEIEKDLGSIHWPENPGTVLLEDLPNWVANEMFDRGDVRRIGPALSRLEERSMQLIVVTCNLYAERASASAEVRAYERALAEAERTIASRADAVIEMVYGIPVFLKGDCQCLSLRPS